MGLDRTFAAAYIDNGIRHRIFGRTLRPFSLWHLLLLQTIDSPFVSNGEVTLFDLKTAIGICSLQYRQSRVHRPILPLSLKVPKLQKAVAAFMMYVGDYLNRPEYTVQEANLSQPRYVGLPLTPAPSVVLIAYRAARGANMPVSVIWDMPIGEAYISEAMFLELNGERLDFLDEEGRQFQADMKAAGI